MTQAVSQLGNSRQLARELEAMIRQGKWAVGSKLPSIRQIAQQHAVSVGTVQRALSQLEAKDLISYSPRRRGLVKKNRQQHPRRSRSTTAPPSPTTLHLGIVFPGGPAQAVTVPDDHESWTGHISRAIHTTANASRYDVLSLAPPTEHDQVGGLLEKLQGMRQSIAGLVIFQLQQMPTLAEGLDELEIPWVSIDRPASNAMHNFVSADFTQAGYVVGRTFAAGQFQRVLMLLGNMAAFRSSAELSTGFMQAYLERGMSPAGIEYRTCAGSTEQLGYEQTCASLANGCRPQAILAAGDRLALGAIRACREFGLECPQDVSIVGGSGLELSRYTSPSLSVIQQPMRQIGQKAVAMLLEMIQAGSSRIPGTLFACEYIQRQSLLLPGGAKLAMPEQWIPQM